MLTLSIGVLVPVLPLLLPLHDAANTDMAITNDILFMLVIMP
jgi:hypothetical protein